MASLLLLLLLLLLAGERRRRGASFKAHGERKKQFERRKEITKFEKKAVELS